MAAAAETIATAVGAPFLRSDFFVGSEKWGVRLNEVAYGSGCDCKRRAAGTNSLIDDGPAIAQILQEGFKVCKQRTAPEGFLSELGAQGSTYADLEVLEVPEEGRQVLQIPALRMRLASLSPVPVADCETPQATLNKTGIEKKVRFGETSEIFSREPDEGENPVRANCKPPTPHKGENPIRANCKPPEPYKGTTLSRTMHSAVLPTPQALPAYSSGLSARSSQLATPWTPRCQLPANFLMVGHTQQLAVFHHTGYAQQTSSMLPQSLGAIRAIH